MIRLAINGILGRMGTVLTHSIVKNKSFILVGGVDTLETFADDAFIVSTEAPDVLSDADVVLDFSSPHGTMHILEACREFGKPVIIGTTGLEKAHHRTIDEAAKEIPIVQAYNFSVGISLINFLIQRATSALQDDFDVEIIDIQHRHKKDSPSGTSLMLAESVTRQRGDMADDYLAFGRSGNDLVRGKEIGIHSLRGGSVNSEHQIHFLLQNESITLSHRSFSPKSFVDGVTRAVHWIHSRQSGRYDMADVLGLSQ